MVMLLGEHMSILDDFNALNQYIDAITPNAEQEAIKRKVRKDRIESRKLANKRTRIENQDPQWHKKAGLQTLPREIIASVAQQELRLQLNQSAHLQQVIVRAAFPKNQDPIDQKTVDQALAKLSKLDPATQKRRLIRAFNYNLDPDQKSALEQEVTPQQLIDLGYARIKTQTGPNLLEKVDSALAKVIAKHDDYITLEQRHIDRLVKVHPQLPEVISKIIGGDQKAPLAPRLADHLRSLGPKEREKFVKTVQSLMKQHASKNDYVQALQVLKDPKRMYVPLNRSGRYALHESKKTLANEMIDEDVYLIIKDKIGYSGSGSILDHLKSYLQQSQPPIDLDQFIDDVADATVKKFQSPKFKPASERKRLGEWTAQSPRSRRILLNNQQIAAHRGYIQQMQPLLDDELRGVGDFCKALVGENKEVGPENPNFYLFHALSNKIGYRNDPQYTKDVEIHISKGSSFEDKLSSELFFCDDIEQWIKEIADDALSLQVQHAHNQIQLHDMRIDQSLVASGSLSDNDPASDNDDDDEAFFGYGTVVRK